MNDLAIQFLKLVKDNSLPHIHGLLSTFVQKADENGWNSVHWAVKNDNLDMLLLLECLTDHTLSTPKTLNSPDPRESSSEVKLALPSPIAANSSNNASSDSKSAPSTPLPSEPQSPSEKEKAGESEPAADKADAPPAAVMNEAAPADTVLPETGEPAVTKPTEAPPAAPELPVGRPLDVLSATTAEYDGVRAGSTPLHIAAMRGNPKIIKALIDRGANVCAVDSEGCNALWLLTHSPDLSEDSMEEGLGLLLEAGCKPEPTLVLYLARTMHAKTLQRLLRVLVSDNILAPSPVLFRGRDGAVALHYASKGGNLEMVTALLDYGSPVNARDNQQNTPLHLAANVSVALLLVSRGARVDLKNAEGVKACAAFEGGNDAKVIKQALQTFASAPTATCVPGKPVVLSDEATWVKDDKSEFCMCCFTKFGLVNRKHHCRLCGILSCGNCTTKKLALADGQAIRVCDGCYNLKVREVAEFNAKPARKKEVRVHVTSLPSPSPTGGGGDFGGLGSADIAAAEKQAAEERAIIERAMEKAASDRAAEKAAEERAAAEKLAAAERAAEKAAEKAAAEKAAAEQDPDDKRAQLFEGRRSGKEGKEEGKKSALKGATATTAEISGVMAQNKTKLIERGQKLEETADKAEGLERSAENFLDMAKKLRKQQESSWF